MKGFEPLPQLAAERLSEISQFMPAARPSSADAELFEQLSELRPW